MTDEIKYMDIKEFRELGFLAELNRRFLHPLGLALEVMVLDDGTEELGGIWDYREDEEGMIFAMQPDPEKIKNVVDEFNKHAEARIKMMGDVIQPLNYPKDSDGVH